MSVSPHSLPTRWTASRRISLLMTRDSSWMRTMARAALCGWFLPLLMALLTAFSSAPVQAQAPVQTVVVLDFAVAAGLDPLLGRKAADGLAVELQRSGDFEVVTRQRVEEAVGQQAGLQPPFNDTAQVRLAQAVGARSVFSGRVAAVDITPGRAARVRLEVKQLDVATGDYINGTGVTETTEQKLQDVANEILVDEAINKSVFSAVRSIKQTTLPEGQVLNTTRDDVELSIGTRNGVAPGQRYTVLRDVFNRAKQVTERVKIGELTIARVESDQSVGVLSAGGAAGIRTGDRIRKIFVTSNYPTTSASASGGSVTPVTAPPISATGNEGGVKGLVKKGSRGFLGLIALAGLVTLAGAGGGSSSSSSSPRVDQPQLLDPNAIYPEASISFVSGFTGIASNLQGESVVGYLIYRGTTPGFAADLNSLQGFVDGRNATSSKQRVTFSDPLQNSTFLINTREINITQGVAGTTNGSINVVDTTNGTNGTTTGANVLNQTLTSIQIRFTPQPIVIGQTYYYRVGRITAERTTTTGTGTNPTTQVQLLPVRSLVSQPTRGFTALVRPQVIRDQAQYNLDDLIVRVNFDPTPYTDLLVVNGSFFNSGFNLPGNVSVASGANQFRVQLSTSTSFDEGTTFTSPDLTPPPTTTLGDVIFNRDNGLGPRVRIPGPYVPGETPLFLRVLSRNTNDAVPIFRISPVVAIGAALGGQGQNLTSRFVSSQKDGRTGGLNIRGRGRSSSGGTYAPTKVRRPY